MQQHQPQPQQDNGSIPDPLTNMLNRGATKDEIKQIIIELFNATGLEQKSVLDPAQIHAIAGIRLYADKYGSVIAHRLADLLLQLCISGSGKGGRGRNDLVKVLNAALLSTEDTQGEKRRKILGL